MIEIKKATIENFITPIEGTGEIRKITLFLVSGKNPRLKKINLDHLSSEDRRAKLKSWGQEYRFVLVIEKGDMVFAHAHQKYAELLQKSDGLSLEGRKVTVKALSDEQAERVSAIGQTLGGQIDEGKGENTKDELKTTHQSQFFSPQQVFAKSHLVRDKLLTHFLLKQMVKRNLGQLVFDCMKRYQEARKELKEKQESEEKFSNIKRSELKKEIARSEIKNREISRKELLAKIW